MKRCRFSLREHPFYTKPAGLSNQGQFDIFSVRNEKNPYLRRAEREGPGPFRRPLRLVHSRRDHGGVLFVDLRDREGLVQIVAHPERKEVFAAADRLRSEYVVCVAGKVRPRPAGTENPHLPTEKSRWRPNPSRSSILPSPCLSRSPNFPRRRKRSGCSTDYLDLRRPALQKSLALRHRMTQAVRRILDAEGFLEIETPFLTKSTPEGARDFLVPRGSIPAASMPCPSLPSFSSRS